MAEEYCGGTNWWDSSPANRTRFDGRGGGGGSGGSSTSSSTTTLANNSGGGGGSGYGWLTDAVARSSLDAVSPTAAASSSLLVSLGLSSQAMDWNHQQQQQQQSSILGRNNNPEKSLRSILQQPEGNMFDLQWRSDKLFSPTNTEESSSTSEFNNMSRSFSLDHHQFSPTGSSMEGSTVTCQGLSATSYQLDSSSSSSVYGSPSSILQGLIGNDQQNHHQAQMNNYPSTGGAANSNFQQNYFNMVPQFLRASSPKQQQQLQFANNAAYWNASGAPTDTIRPSFFSNSQLPMPSFEEKPKNTMEVRETSSTMKKSGSENNNKRGRNETAASSTLPPFKVRKEKMGDRITALQQLVSPFGKTDTASVLSEAIEYIKFLHEQVSVLSTPYLKSGASYQQQHQQSNDKVKIDPEGPKQDLRSRGLCLVPVSSTFPVTHETTVDFWTPTFGGTFR